MITYSPTSSFWMNNRVTNACYKMYNIMAPTVRERIDNWENSMMVEVAKADSEAMELYNKAQETPRKKIKRNDFLRRTPEQFASVRDFLTRFSVDNAQKIFREWVELEQLLLVKYIDGNVKAQNPDGSFVTNGYTDHIPEGITQPGYTEKWKSCVVKDHGDVIVSE